ncbi:uncharacterized protein E5676_scaffold349G00120 [Cucumis melo var. makuwa]|uniref:Envelope-like protein n=1 Tax=Cucumis melo var. makuwa TaxID=1194695 RepID=A0A5D3E4D1_CUCMM|nr:uncharacterized protein E5676_scaffold349G00120 [Cucumis melo var. makuwa]
MVNTRKGTYAGKSSEEVHEVSSPKGAMHGVRMCSRRFKTRPSASEAHLTDMDFDDLDDSQESSSTEGVFVPTLGIAPASKVQPGPFVRFLPSPSLPVASDDVHASIPNDVPGDVSVAREEQPDALSDENEVDPSNPEVCTDKVPTNADDTPTIPPCSFKEENVQRWKFVVQRRLANEVNVSDKHQSYMSIIDLIGRTGLAKTISNAGPFYPHLIREFIVNLPDEFNDPSSPDYHTVHVRGFKFVVFPVVINGFLGNVVDIDYSPSSPSSNVLASVLSGGTLSMWPVNGIPALFLALNMPFCIRLILLIGSLPLMPPVYLQPWQLFCIKFGSHVPDIDQDVHLSRGPRVFVTSDWAESAEGFFVDGELTSRIVNSLAVESQALSTFINLLFGRRLEVDALICQGFCPIYQ